MKIRGKKQAGRPPGPPRGASRALRFVKFGVAVAVGLGLGAVAYFFGWAAALALLSLILVGIVWRLWLAANLAHAAVQAKLDKITNDHESVIEVLCTAAGLRDSARGAQAQMVAEMASVVAWQMGLKEEGVRLVKKAAILADIGKVGIAANVLSKPAALSDQEWEEMRRHPQVGYEILSEIPSLRDVAEIVYAHHERFDGQGYPRGLKGDQIPLASRIFAVVDAYVAMTSDRPYRKKMSHDLAVREIVRNSLTQFDPEVVEAFLQAQRAGLIRIPRQQGAPAPERREYAPTEA